MAGFLPIVFMALLASHAPAQYCPVVGGISNLSHQVGCLGSNVTSCESCLSAPVIGTNLVIQAGCWTSGQYWDASVLALGYSVSMGHITLPPAPFHWAYCQWVDIDPVLFFANPGPVTGTSSQGLGWSIPVPNNPLLVGAILYSQQAGFSSSQSAWYAGLVRQITIQ